MTTPVSFREVAGAFFELVNGAAYRPRPSDPTVPLSRRLEGQTVLVLALARDRAATQLVRFESGRSSRIGESRQFAARDRGELVRAVAAEAARANVAWAVVVLTLGWQAQIAPRAARQPGDAAFDRFRVLRDEPELLVSQPKADFVYAAVDHPTLDRSIVFSCRRKDVDDMLADVAAAGLRVAGVRLGVASQLEHWFNCHRNHALDRDLLVTDGMSVLLVNAFEGDLVAVGHGGREGSPVPRQASARPAEVPRDLARFLRDNGDRPVRYLGPPELLDGAIVGAELCAQVLKESEDATAMDGVVAALSDCVTHDLNPGVHAERSALPGCWRKWVWSALGCELLLLLALGVLTWSALVARWRTDAELRAIRISNDRAAVHRREGERMRAERTQAEAVRSWIGANYHAQRLLVDVLGSLPPGVALESFSAHLDEGSPQMALEFVLVGGDEAQVATARALEKTVLGLDFQIGERSVPVPAGRGLSYRWRLIMPPMSGEGTRT